MAKIHPAIAGRVMEENEKLRGLLFEAIHCCPDEQLRNEMKAALPWKAEPECEYCDGTGDVHRADGEWLGECKECDAAEPAPAQDERDTFCAYCGGNDEYPQDHCMDCTRPLAQTEQQPCSDTLIKGAKALLALDEKGSLVPHGIGGLAREVIEKLIARVEHTAPQPEQSELVEALEQFADNGKWRYDTCNISRDVAKDALVAKDETP